MFEFLVLISILFMLFVGYSQVYPMVRKYMNYRHEREALTRQYNRTWRARRDMLVRKHIS